MDRLKRTKHSIPKSRQRRLMPKFPRPPWFRSLTGLNPARHRSSRTRPSISFLEELRELFWLRLPAEFPCSSRSNSEKKLAKPPRLPDDKDTFYRFNSVFRE